MPSLVEEAREIWDAKAAWWDDVVNDTYPVCGELVDQLLGVRPGMQVLEVACGNGIFSRRLARLGADVLACDFSEMFLRTARARTPAELAGRIDYRLMDATDETQLRELDSGRFDAALCSMGLMDMPDVRPLMLALRRLLKPDAAFVFSVTHPCFNHLGSSKLVEQRAEDGAMVTAYAVKVDRYLSSSTGKNAGIEGEPQPHLYFDRPLTALLRPGFEEGFVVDALEEAPAVLRDGAAPLSWGHFPEIPAFLLVRMRRHDGHC